MHPNVPDLMNLWPGPRWTRVTATLFLVLWDANGRLLKRSYVASQMAYYGHPQRAPGTLQRTTHRLRAVLPPDGPVKVVAVPGVGLRLDAPPGWSPWLMEDAA